MKRIQRGPVRGISLKLQVREAKQQAYIDSDGEQGGGGVGAREQGRVGRKDPPAEGSHF
jgi:hypothetical protein